MGSGTGSVYKARLARLNASVMTCGRWSFRFGGSRSSNARSAPPKALSRRARARWACVSSSPTQAQRARARRDNPKRKPHRAATCHVVLDHTYARRRARRITWSAKLKAGLSRRAGVQSNVVLVEFRGGTDLARGARLNHGSLSPFSRLYEKA